MADPFYVVGAGNGGISEMRTYVSSTVVQWAIFKVELGEGALKRKRVVFLHINSDDIQDTIARGQDNALTSKVQNTVRDCILGRNCFHASFTVTRLDEITSDNLLRLASRVFAVDEDVDYSVEWVIKQYEKQIDHARLHACPNGFDRPRSRASTTTFNSGRDALKAVAQPLGPWNWLFVEANPETLTLKGGGGGSVQEMRSFVADNSDAVMFGMLRMGFGVGRLRRTKYVFVHATGAAVTAVTRGKLGALRAVMQDALRKVINFSVALEIKNAEELTLEDVIERIRKAAAIDDDDIGPDVASKSAISLEDYYKALEEERRVQSTRSQNPGGGRPIEEVVKLVRADDGPLNWALFAAEEGHHGKTEVFKVSAAAMLPTGGFLAAADRAANGDSTPENKRPPVATWRTSLLAKRSSEQAASVPLTVPEARASEITIEEQVSPTNRARRSRRASSEADPPRGLQRLFMCLPKF
eukprot:TRINITY_DN16950_c0_g1_i2.p1 TRINITY_DN16950_c0_g1~~TRINITY_DN16950_c0_g1_i2.p1  ORF type:complete len:478 (-),score=77.40 TRINITY_DN16950_c0_g1_i2:339-1748(-)